MKGRDKFQVGRAALLRGLNFGRRGSAALPIATILFFAVGAMAQTTNGLSDAEIQGRQLVQKIFEQLEQQPTENFTNTGHLTIRRKDGPRAEFLFQFRAVVTASNWQAIYETKSESYRVKFLIVHDIEGNRFFEVRNDEKIKSEPTFPFAGSDSGRRIWVWNFSTGRSRRF